MKLYILPFLLFAPAVLHAQSSYDAATLAESDLVGTAKYVSMGGALGALGADITTSSTNPAGTALFRSNDAQITFGAVQTTTPAQLGYNRTLPTIDQGGAVFVVARDFGHHLNSLNFGVNFLKKRNSLSNVETSFLFPNGGSQTYQLANNANDAVTDWGIEYEKEDPYENWGDGLTYRSTPLLFEENYHYYPCDAAAATYQRYVSGFNSEVDLNISANFDDRYYVGLSVGIYSKVIDRYALYSETGVDGIDYAISNYYHSKSDGFDIKLGTIIRPFENSPFRIGLSVHTPIWYKMLDYNDMIISSAVYDRPTEFNSNSYRIKVRTPWVFGLSLGHTFGTKVALGAEYEFQDYSTCHYSPVDGTYSTYIPEKNQDISRNLKSVHTAKVGIEYRPIKILSLRAGYNFVSSPYVSDAVYNLPYNSTYTETDYTNWNAIHRATVGLGVRLGRFYADFAYQRQMQTGDFYPYYVPMDEEGTNAVTPTSISNNRNSFTCTLGLRF